MRSFAAVGLDRPLYDSFRKEGFSTAQIADNARDAKALGWHGKDDLTISQHASVEARKAAVAVEQTKTPEAKAAGAAARGGDRAAQRSPPGQRPAEAS